MMNKIFICFLIIFYVIVSSESNNINDDESNENIIERKSITEKINETCALQTGNGRYFLKLDEDVRKAKDCFDDVFDNTTRRIRENEYVRLYNAVCNNREDYYDCLEIALDSYSLCLNVDENFGLTTIRNLIRRSISQLCTIDSVKITEFLSGNGVDCYANNEDDIMVIVNSIIGYQEINNPHLPSSYINDKTCGKLHKIKQEVRPILEACEDQQPDNLIDNFIHALRNELSCH